MRATLSRFGLPIALALTGCTQAVTLGSVEVRDAAIDSGDAARADGGTCGADDVMIWGSSICVRYVWDGRACVVARGCDCSGTCGRASDTYLACMELHTSCWQHDCSDAQPCPTGYFCARASCSATTGTCAAIPTDGCVLATPEPTCGCDGVLYPSRCDVARASQSVASTCADAG